VEVWRMGEDLHGDVGYGKCGAGVPSCGGGAGYLSVMFLAGKAGLKCGPYLLCVKKKTPHPAPVGV
jgi:hypothetical protein